MLEVGFIHSKSQLLLELIEARSASWGWRGGVLNVYYKLKSSYSSRIKERKSILFYIARRFVQTQLKVGNIELSHFYSHLEFKNYFEIFLLNNYIH